MMKSDGEPAIVAVREALARKHGGIVSLEQPPKGEHASNGVVEEAGRTIRDMAKVLKMHLESRLGRALHMKEPIMHWLVRWAAMALSRFQVGKDHKKACQRQTGKACNEKKSTRRRKGMVQKGPHNRTQTCDGVQVGRGTLAWAYEELQ